MQKPAARFSDRFQLLPYMVDYKIALIAEFPEKSSTYVPVLLNNQCFKVYGDRKC